MKRMRSGYWRSPPSESWQVDLTQFDCWIPSFLFFFFPPAAPIVCHEWSAHAKRNYNAVPSLSHSLSHPLWSAFLPLLRHLRGKSENTSVKIPVIDGSTSAIGDFGLKIFCSSFRRSWIECGHAYFASLSFHDSQICEFLLERSLTLPYHFVRWANCIWLPTTTHN